MAEYCDICFKQIDPFNPCNHSSSADPFSTHHDAFSHSGESGNILLIWVAAASGLILDFAITFSMDTWWSLLITSLISSGIVIGIWANLGSRFNANVVLRNIPNYLLAPLAFRIYSPVAKRASHTRDWAIIFGVSLVLQAALFTPADGQSLVRFMQHEIENATGRSLDLHCPGFKIVVPPSQLTCEVETGVLNITIPARIEVSGITGVNIYNISAN